MLNLESIIFILQEHQMMVILRLYFLREASAAFGVLACIHFLLNATWRLRGRANRSGYQTQRAFVMTKYIDGCRG